MVSELVQKALNDGSESATEGRTSRRAFLTGGLAAALTATTAIASAQSRKTAPGSYGQVGAPLTGGKPVGNGGGAAGLGVNHTIPANGAPVVPSAGANGLPTVPTVDNGKYWLNVNTKLLRRITYGATKAEQARVEDIGFQAFLDEQLNPSSIDDSACEALVAARTSRLGVSLADAMRDSNANWWRYSRDVLDAQLYRMMYSKRQLHQKMVEFWMDHFYVDDMKLMGPEAMALVRDVIWPNALGNFNTLLTGSVKSAAVMKYLDNQQNTVSARNVNFARELMELYTVGVLGGYSENDIVQVSKIFTGWSIKFTDDGSQTYHNFQYKSDFHEQGNRTVMGQSFNQQGEAQGDAFLAFLGSHPKTAEYVSGKLVEYFLGYRPTQHMKEMLRDEWLATGGDIKSVLRLILTPDLLQFTPAKFKRPMHLVVGALRQIDPRTHNATHGMHDHLFRMEHLFFRWNQPDGYPDRFDFWAPGMVHRLHYAMQLANNKVWQVSWFPDDIFGQNRDATVIFDEINDRFFGGEMPYQDAMWLRRYLRSKANLTAADIRAAFAIALGSPGYQWF